MPRNPKIARLSSVGYRAMFTPRAPQVEKEIVVISDDEEWMATPTPTLAPALTLAVAPVYAVAATPMESSATSPMLVPPPPILWWMRRWAGRANTTSSRPRRLPTSTPSLHRCWMTTTLTCTPPSTITVQSTSTLWRQPFGR